MDINVQKLSLELRAAGISTHGNCNSSGVVWDDDNNEIQNRSDVAALLANHNPNETTLTPSQQIILANGEDIARVTITGEPGATVEYTVNGQVLSLTLDASGMDTIQLDCDTPNTTLLVQAGTARAVIYAVEVPS